MSRPLPLNAHLIDVGPLVYGCMALGGDWGDGPIAEADIAHAHAAVEAALGIGIKLFDHADIYRRGKAEAVFGELLKRDAGLRGKIRLQSKCGIRFGDDSNPGRYDLSADYIEKSVDGILKRLSVHCIDILLLHRPDALMEPAEVARAFGRLKAAGKVQHLGVSNMHAGQMRWLQTALNEPIVANQLELSLAKLDAIDVGTTFNDPQATTSAAAAAVHEIAETHGTTANAVLLAWLLRHPAGIQPVIGSGNAERIRACGDATKIQLSRDEWYRLYVAARGQALP
jgi:predicted oxidoreductase